MRYSHICTATFISRPNRFIAEVDINGKKETVHVKNTGRCKELLIPGVEVVLEESSNPDRKTKYDLVSVKKKKLGWVNIDSSAPNKLAAEWLKTQNFDYIRPEYTYGNSRIDFYMEKGNKKYLMEVKGCTLEIDGDGYFPDAPTERGVKHLNELIRASKEGYTAIIAFVIQMNGITTVFPNRETHPEFAETLEKAIAAGVKVLLLPCDVKKQTVKVIPA